MENFVVFSIVSEWGDILTNWLNCLFGTKVSNILDTCWQMLLTKLQCTKINSADLYLDQHPCLYLHLI